MNYMQLLSSVLGKLTGNKSLKLFNQKKKNRGWVWISILGISLLSFLGSRSSRVNQEVQKKFEQAKNSFQSSSEPKRNPFDVNFDIATEIAKEIKPDFQPQTPQPKNE
ncbi:hypothetical protein [Bacillus timonensis]|uniref:hypothetical protein n=1 Tax=Bacillus timonensis TaxID=1033734 RepID=UPI0002889612|nr:hypothetical protein [Bacillus timonensis]